MRKTYIRIFIAVFMVVIFADGTYAQSTVTDSVLAAQQLKNSKTYYNDHIADQSRLLNGIKYVPYKPQSYVGNAYYLTSDLQNAYLNYDGADLYNVPVVFDLYRNLIVIKDQEGSGYVSLFNTKLNKFTIANHTFFKILTDSTEKVLQSGFYDLQYNGPTQLLVRRTKTIEIEKSTTAIQNIFTVRNFYYLRKNNIYYAVSSKGDVLNLLKDKKKELGQYIRANDLSFSQDDKEQSIIKLVTYYDQLTR